MLNFLGKVECVRRRIWYVICEKGERKRLVHWIVNLVVAWHDGVLFLVSRIKFDWIYTKDEKPINSCLDKHVHLLGFLLEIADNF